MKIKEFETYPEKEKRYNIIIRYDELLNGEEIALCFKEQYPSNLCVISCTKIKQLEFGIIILGLKIK